MGKSSWFLGILFLSFLTVAFAGETKSKKVVKKMEAKYDLSVDKKTGLSKAVAMMELEKGGEVKIGFYTNKAPKTVERIAYLIDSGFYNGVTFHRLVPNFVVQGGDPTGTGAGGSGQKLKAEFNDIKHVEGILSMARAQDKDSADSQFFIMLGTSPHLDGQYTAFGKVLSGFELVKKIEKGDKIKKFIIR